MTNHNLLQEAIDALDNLVEWHEDRDNMTYKLSTTISIACLELEYLALTLPGHQSVMLRNIITQLREAVDK